MTRFLAASLFVALAALATGCGKSNNEGIILGKWKIVSAPGVDAEMVRELEAEKLYAYMEFLPDGKAVIGVTSHDPEVLKELAEAGELLTFPCKYKLRSGDGLELYDLPKEMQEQGGFLGRSSDRAQTKVKITGDNMTMTDPDGQVGTLVRIHPNATPPTDNPKPK